MEAVRFWTSNSVFTRNQNVKASLGAIGCNDTQRCGPIASPGVRGRGGMGRLATLFLPFGREQFLTVRNNFGRACGHVLQSDEVIE